MVKSVLSPEVTTDYTFMIEFGAPGFLMVIIGSAYIAFGFLSRIFFLPLAKKQAFPDNCNSHRSFVYYCSSYRLFFQGGALSLSSIDSPKHANRFDGPFQRQA